MCLARLFILQFFHCPLRCIKRPVPFLRMPLYLRGFDGRHVAHEFEYIDGRQSRRLDECSKNSAMPRVSFAVRVIGGDSSEENGMARGT
jgi:hypothetical protein